MNQLSSIKKIIDNNKKYDSYDFAKNWNHVSDLLHDIDFFTELYIPIVNEYIESLPVQPYPIEYIYEHMALAPTEIMSADFYVSLMESIVNTALHLFETRQNMHVLNIDIKWQNNPFSLWHWIPVGNNDFFCRHVELPIIKKLMPKYIWQIIKLPHHSTIVCDELHLFFDLQTWSNINLRSYINEKLFGVTPNYVSTNIIAQNIIDIVKMF